MADADAPRDDCEHVWRLTGAVLADGAYTGYECPRCDTVMMVGPGAVHPETA